MADITPIAHMKKLASIAKQALKSNIICPLSGSCGFLTCICTSSTQFPCAMKLNQIQMRIEREINRFRCGEYAFISR